MNYQKQRWQTDAEFMGRNGKPKWLSRTKAAARLIEPGWSVLDLGCGLMTLRDYLPAGCTYVGADLFSRSAEIIAVDLDTDDLPVGNFDAMVLLGIFGRLKDPMRVARLARRQSRHLIISHVISRLPKRDYASQKDQQVMIERIEQEGWVLDKIVNRRRFWPGLLRPEVVMRFR